MESKMVNLVGTWKHVSLELRRSDGQITYPLGEDVIGYSLLNEDGYVMMSMMSANRPNFFSKDVLGGTIEEKASAYDTYSTYCGTYEIQGNKITYHLEMNLFPNWIGGKQERFFEVRGDRLIVSSPSILVQGVEQQAHTIWERVYFR